MAEKTEAQLTLDIFTHIHQILERDGDQAEVTFNAIQLRKILSCEPGVIYETAPDDRTAHLPPINFDGLPEGPRDLGGFNCAGEYRWPKKDD
jgi:hypothetical protein